MNKIIALVDFSEVTRSVIDFAAKQAKAFGAELILLHAEPEAYEKLYRKIDADERSRRARKLRFEHGDLQAKAAELKSLGLVVQSMLLEGAEADVLIKEIDKLQPDLVVMGNHHHSAIYSFFNGSVGEEIVDQLTCPTVLISS